MQYFFAESITIAHAESRTLLPSSTHTHSRWLIKLLSDGHNSEWVMIYSLLVLTHLSISL